MKDTLKHLYEYEFFQKHFMFVWYATVDTSQLCPSFEYAIKHRYATQVLDELDIIYSNIERRVSQIVHFNESCGDGGQLTKSGVIKKALMLICDYSLLVNYRAVPFTEEDYEVMYDLFSPKEKTS